MEDFSSGLPKTNPASGREENLNPGPPDYKYSALTTRPRRLPPVSREIVVLANMKDVIPVCQVFFLFVFFLLLLF